MSVFESVIDYPNKETGTESVSASIQVALREVRV